jgi:hypothetical protein
VPTSDDEKLRLESLRADYKGAFHEWALQVSRLQDAAGASPEACAVQAAEARVSAAQVDYRDSRDRLIDEMSGKTEAFD